MSRILVVDDSKFSRSRVVSAVADLSRDVVQAVDGQDALDQLAQGSVDLILTDLLMPRLDGFGLLRTLRNQGDQTPVIVISADIQASSRELCQSLDVKYFLNKPFYKNDLVNAVTAVLAARQEATQSW
jgi:CheY-like chemotaxis protein